MTTEECIEIKEVKTMKMVCYLVLYAKNEPNHIKRITNILNKWQLYYDLTVIPEQGGKRAGYKQAVIFGDGKTITTSNDGFVTEPMWYQSQIALKGSGSQNYSMSGVFFEALELVQETEEFCGDEKNEYILHIITDNMLCLEEAVITKLLPKLVAEQTSEGKKINRFQELYVNVLSPEVSEEDILGTEQTYGDLESQYTNWNAFKEKHQSKIHIVKE